MNLPQPLYRVSWEPPGLWPTRQRAAHQWHLNQSPPFSSFPKRFSLFPYIPFSKYDKGDVTCKMKHEPTKTTSQNPCFCSIIFTELRNDFVKENSKKTAAKIRYRRDRSHWGCHHT